MKLEENSARIRERQQDSKDKTREYFAGIRKMKAKVACRKMLFEQATQVRCPPQPQRREPPGGLASSRRLLL